MLEKAKEMFIFGYDSYMTYAFPMDELDPIHCKGNTFYFSFGVFTINIFLYEDYL